MSADHVATAVARKSPLGPLWLQVLIGAILGIIFGVMLPDAAAQTAILAQGFVNLIRMVLAPVIFITVVVGIARMGNLREVGRVGVKAILYFEVLSTISLIIGVLAAEIAKPGSRLHVDPHSLNVELIQGYAKSATQMTFQGFLLNLIPTSITEAFAQNNMLQIIVFAVLFGVVLAQLQQKVEPLLNVLEQLMTALFGVVRLVMYLAPLAAFGGMAFTIGKYGLGSVISLGEFVACCYIASAIFVIVVLGLVARAFGIKLFALLRYLREELLIVFSTSSSEAVLPQVMEKLEKIGCPRTIVGLVVPTGITFNADGTAIYLSLAALFIAQATGTPLTYTQEAVILLVLMLTSKGSAGVAGAGFVTLAATLATMNTIPLAGIVLLLGVDRFVNPPRALINVIGNSLGTIVIAIWEKDFDRVKAADILR